MSETETDRSMRRRFDRWWLVRRRGVSRLGTKIALGFAVVLMLHICVATVGHLGINRARTDLEMIDGDRHVNDEMVAIDGLVRELQQHVLPPMMGGHTSNQERVTELHDELRLRIANASTRVTSRDLVAMGAVLERYNHEFVLAEEDRERRDHLVNISTVEAARATASGLARLEHHALQADRATQAVMDRAQREFVQAETEVLEYVHRLDYEAVTSAIERLALCDRLIRGLDWPDNARQDLRRASERLAEHDDILDELIRRMRGYLHLSNVVIAGETVELLRLSKRVREEQSARVEASYLRAVASQRSFETFSLWVSIITILVGLTASMAITRIVVRPLRAISETFRQLASGNRDVAIPSRERRDEIGDLTRAAAVFKAVNDDTASLLEETQRSNGELQQFAYVASHDLQEPLRMVTSYVQLIEMRYVDELDDKARLYIDYAVDGTVRMKALIDDLLAYSRVGSAERVPERLALSKVVYIARANLRTAIDECGATIVHEDMPTIVGDLGQLAQVMQNLISNALKFRGDRSPEIHVGGREEATRWVIWVRDNGIGIDPEHAERIFTVFQRLHGRSDYAGTGIGLAICRRVVERHGGELWVESHEGLGATFFFTLARSDEHALRERGAATASASALTSSV